MKIRAVQAVLMFGAASVLMPAAGQTPAQEVTAAMQGQFATQVREGCSSELSPGCDQALTNIGVK